MRPTGRRTTSNSLLRATPERTTTMHAEFRGIKFDDSILIDPSDFIPSGPKGMSYNPHNVHPWLFHDHGFALCVCFADCLQDALDIAADSGMIDRFRVSPTGKLDYEPDGEGLTYLGNASEPFDIESLSVEELPNPAFSFVALFNANK
jgi:hypothetical protein